MSEQISVKILFFANAKEAVGKESSEIVINSSVKTKSGLLDSIELSFPDLKPLQRTFAIALNEEYLQDQEEVEISAGDTVAIIPPLSGG